MRNRDSTDKSNTKQRPAELKFLSLHDSEHAFMHVALQQFHESMAVFPDNVTEAYREASTRVPSAVIRIEAPELNFLQWEDFHPWKAAWRCANYWQERKKTFGEKAHLPLMQSNSKGALSALDMDILKSGCISLTVLESESEETRHRHMLCIDTVKLRSFEATDEAAAKRCIFYLLNVCMETAETVETGIDFVAFIDHDTGAFLEELHGWKEMAETAFRVSRARIHVLSNDSASQLSPIEEEKLGETSLRIHRSKSKEQLSALLKTIGLPPHVLPEWMGGPESTERASMWQQERTRKESEKYGESCVSRTSASSEATESTESGSSRKQSTVGKGASPGTKITLSKKRKASPSITSLNMDEKEVMRKRNAAYSKRKYHRKKIEIEVLQKQTADLKQQNGNLKNERKRLEELLWSVKTKVGLLETTEDANIRQTPVRLLASSAQRGSGLELMTHSFGQRAIPEHISVPSLAYMRGGSWPNSSVQSPGFPLGAHLQSIQQAPQSGTSGSATLSIAQIPLTSRLLAASTTAALSPSPYLETTASTPVLFQQQQQQQLSNVLQGVAALNHASIPTSGVPLSTLSAAAQPTMQQHLSVNEFRLREPSMPAPNNSNEVLRLLEQLLRARR